MADSPVVSEGKAETVVRSFFEALRTLKGMEAEASTPLGKSDPMLNTRIKELRGYIDVFLKAEAPRKPRLVILEHKPDPREPVIAEVYFHNAIQFYEALTLSFSKGGLFLKTDLLLPIDTVFDLTVKLEDEEISFRTAAKVIWINPRDTQGRPQGMGIKFHRLNQVQRQVLDDFLNGSLPPEALGHLTEV